MARCQVLYWKDFPLQVKAEDSSGKVKAALPDRFQQAVDAAAMADDSTDTDSYLDALAWGPMQERPGSAQDALNALLAEIDAMYSPARLQQMILARKGE